ncbi:hypothetical protein H4CHR_00072 [Variovorax sp. PBS-H4]|uniref:hypothetical protein n=1 Tax=Variovorax sp. PBS-H4 TaxID=434008 RepID=UPI0013164AF6|nr:hypothetical protein [Variovorax sp. PBS-H4]VTU17865.1 hypothetical protein H4CHR_00072 [Variovorax sp. PBS-H4]
MPRHAVPRRPEMHRPQRDPDSERWRDEYMRRFEEEHGERRTLRPHAGPADVGEQPQSPGAKPLRKTQQQQH